MTPRNWALTGGALVLAVVLGVYTWSCRARGREQTATAQAAQHTTAATAAAAQGGVYGQQLEVAQQATQKAEARAKAADARVAGLQAEVARLRAAAAYPPVPGAVPGVPGDQPAGGPPDLAPLVAAQDELIKAQDARHETDEQEKADLRTSLDLAVKRGDAFQAAHEEDQKAMAAQRVAHEAALSMARAERWKGRIEGLVVGLGAGYVAGRLM